MMAVAPPRPAHSRPLVVGIVNCTPDSFYDGGRHGGAAGAIAHGERLVDEGADWLDIGGESTRPGAAPVDAEEEARRVLPIIQALTGSVPLSIDTTKPAVAAAALAAGATILNDVRGLIDGELAAVSADAWATIVMHSRGTPQTMGDMANYDDVVAHVVHWLEAAAARSRSAHTWIDPGIGFAKSAAQSLALLRCTDALVGTGWPVCIGASRKSFIGDTLGIPAAEDRLPGSLAAVASAYHGGARLFRVHDVAETRQHVDLLHAINHPTETTR
jgi:dihydropteroate synthase